MNRKFAEVEATSARSRSGRSIKTPKRSGTLWIASFAFQPAGALAKAAEANGRSSTATWQLVDGDPAAAVAHLRDEEELPWKMILERLKEEGHAVSEVTARRAYDHAHRDSELSESITVPTGRRTCGRSKRLGREVRATIERLLDQHSPSAEAGPASARQRKGGLIAEGSGP